MPGFLNKKKNNASTTKLSEKPIIGSPQAPAAPSGPTPLYARFASNGTPSPTPPSGNKVVSGPMMLQQQRPSLGDRQKSDDSRRVNPTLRGGQQVLPPSTGRSKATPKLDKPLPPPGPPSPMVDEGIPSLSNTNIHGVHRPVNQPPQPVLAASPPRRTSVFNNGPANPLHPASNGLRQPPSSFARPGVTGQVMATRKVEVSSLMSDIPDHMFNIHNLDFDSEPDPIAKNGQHNPRARPLPNTQPQNPLPHGAAKPRSQQPPQSPPQAPLQALKKEVTQSPHIPLSTARHPPGGADVAVNRIQQPAQPSQPSSPSNRRISQQPTSPPTLARSASKTAPHAAMMQTKRTSAIPPPPPPQMQTQVATVNSHMPSPAPAVSASPASKRFSTTENSPYALATPPSKLPQQSAPQSQPKRRIINLDDSSAPIPTPIPVGAKNEPIAQQGPPPVRRGPLIFANANDPLAAAPEHNAGPIGRHPEQPVKHHPVVNPSAPPVNHRPMVNPNAPPNNPAVNGRANHRQTLPPPPSPETHIQPAMNHRPMVNPNAPPNNPAVNGRTSHRQNLPSPPSPEIHTQSPAQMRAHNRLSKQPQRKPSNTALHAQPPHHVESSPQPRHRPQSTFSAMQSRTAVVSATPSNATVDSSYASQPSSLRDLHRHAQEQPQPHGMHQPAQRQESPTRRRGAPVSALQEPLTPPHDAEEKKTHHNRLVKQKSGQLGSGSRPGTADRAVLPPRPETPAKVDDETIRNAGLPLDDDPFAMSEGVTVLPAPSAQPEESVVVPSSSRPTTPKEKISGAAAFGFNPPLTPPLSPPQTRARADGLPIVPPVALADVIPAHDRDPAPFPLPFFLSSSPRILRSVLTWLDFYDFVVIGMLNKELRRALEGSEELKEEVLERFLGIVGYERWPAPYNGPDVNGNGRTAVKVKGREVDEGKEPLRLTLKDLTDYMRGVSMPTHEYARTAAHHLHQTRALPKEERDPEVTYRVQAFIASTRAYTRVVLRLRAQAERMQKEKEKRAAGMTPEERERERKGRETTPQPISPPNAYYNARPSPSRPSSRSSSRAPSPSHSMFSHSHHGHSSNYGHGHSQSPARSHGGHHGQGQSSPSRRSSPPHENGTMTLKPKSSAIFNSPLYRLRRAPLLRVFVPSPEGTWLSDASVLECEAELRRAGVVGLLRPGDAIWDVAVGDEGNVGRMVWDGSYLIDLDYTYSNVGDLPKYMHALAFPPSYFHKVIRTGSSTANPIIHLDIAPWGEEIASHLQLLQDRVRTETPQGNYHNVVRWVHRSSFVIRPPPPKMPSTSAFHDPRRQRQALETPIPSRIPIPSAPGSFVDAGWYGTVVVETEGTNEALADLQDRCGPGAFPPRAGGVNHGNRAVAEKEREQKRVFRILREKSRPGEIWIRAVTVKERIL